MLALAVIAVLVGAGLVSAGAALAYPPAGLIVGGLLLVAAGWFLVDVGDRS